MATDSAGIPMPHVFRAPIRPDVVQFTSPKLIFGNMCRGGRMFAPTKVWRMSSSSEWKAPLGTFSDGTESGRWTRRGEWMLAFRGPTCYDRDLDDKDAHRKIAVFWLSYGEDGELVVTYGSPACSLL
jgi:hypothetical protein